MPPSFEKATSKKIESLMRMNGICALRGSIRKLSTYYTPIRHRMCGLFALHFRQQENSGNMRQELKNRQSKASTQSSIRQGRTRAHES
jgi:hypothetical protein